MRPAPAQVGDPVGAIDSPALVVELDAFERNLAAMSAFARSHGVRLRPHAKTHKCAAIALQQIARGAVGVCVQKVGEALALAAGGVRDVFVSNEVIAPAKLARLTALPSDVNLAVAVDSVAGIERLAAAIHAGRRQIEVFVEIDAGQGRCGVPPAEAGALARQVVAHTGLRFAGLQAYHGGAQHLRSTAERETAIRHAVAMAVAARAAVTSLGIDCPLVTGAGSGSFLLEATSGIYGEIQPGSYVFMDADYARNEAMPGAPRFEHALFVRSQVIGRHAAHAVVDAGHKSHAVDSGLPTVWGRDLAFTNGGDEHGLLHPRGREPLPAPGETVWLVPGHCDPTVNLHEHLVGVRGGLDEGIVEAVWTIDARGRLD
jgi:D-serine deaminase-like pyridoxal phosphate-dependent protein